MKILQLVFTICMGLVNYSTCEIITMKLTPTLLLRHLSPPVCHIPSPQDSLALTASERNMPYNSSPSLTFSAE